MIFIILVFFIVIGFIIYDYKKLGGFDPETRKFITKIEKKESDFEMDDFWDD